jgi:hypothetical protein
MTEERGADPTSRRDSGVPPRLAGGALGAILSTVAIAIAVRIDMLLVANPRDSVIAVVFGASGIGGGEPLGTLLVWAVGPVAAFIGGWFFAAPAIGGTAGSGLWMGAVTYVLSILIAPIVFVPGAAAEGIDALRNLGAVPFLWLGAGAALGPLLGVCLLAGPIWAGILRRTTGGAALGHTSARSLPIWPVVALSVLTFAAWAIVMSVLATTGSGPID